MSDITPSKAADPRRGTRRNHYQEGPGFLFLATQNGRPRKEEDRPDLGRVRERMRAVRRAQQVGVEDAASELGVARRSLYRWSAAFEATGITGLLDGCRRPHRLRTMTPAWVDVVVIAIRLHTYWNSKRIAAEMRRRHIFKVSRTTSTSFSRRWAAVVAPCPEPLDPGMNEAVRTNFGMSTSKAPSLLT